MEWTVDKVQSALENIVENGILLSFQDTKFSPRKNLPLFRHFIELFPGLCRNLGEFQNFSRRYIEPGFAHYMFCPECGLRKPWKPNSSYGNYREYCSIQCASRAPKTRENFRKTMQESYGVNYTWESEYFREISADTCKSRHGARHPMHCKEIYDQVCDHHGSPEFREAQSKRSKLDSAREAYRKTSQDRFGADHYLQTNEGRTVISEALKSTKARETFRRTCLDNFGVDHPMLSEIVRQSVVETNLIKYGKEHWAQTLEGRATLSAIMGSGDVIRRSYETRRKNGTFLISREESHILYQFRSLFPNTVSQYKSPRYSNHMGIPWACDFYVPELDLFIEYQGSWTHGFGPFDPEQDWCKEQLSKWLLLSQSSAYYRNAIYVWTDLDVRKRQCAQSNNLNWIEFFSIQEFHDWIKDLTFC